VLASLPSRKIGEIDNLLPGSWNAATSKKSWSKMLLSLRIMTDRGICGV